MAEYEVWGGRSSQSGYEGHEGELGILYAISHTDTKTTVDVNVYLWTLHGVNDENNHFYYDIGTNVSAAVTNKGKQSIYIEGKGNWNVQNRQRLLSQTYTYDRGVSDVTYNIYAKLTGIEYGGGTTTVNTSFVVPKLASYVVSYNNNGGTGSPSSQTKYYGKNITLSSVKPTRSGYSFQGWATSSGGSVAYQPGATYSANASVTLYAKWIANTYTVTYNANGGTNAPSAQTKTHDVTLKLTSAVPSREFHNFLGWSISQASDEVSYLSGGSYTSNSSVTLYAVWELAYLKPRITNASVSRCTSEGVVTDEGTYAIVSFDWECDYDVESITVSFAKAGTGTWSHVSISATGTSGSVSKIIGGNALDTEEHYSVIVSVVDVIDDSTVNLDIPSQRFPIDVLVGGNGVSIGKDATKENTLEVAYTLNTIKNRYSASSLGVAGESGYILMAQITFTGTNANWPITFIFSNRKALSPMTVHLSFKSSSDFDPDLSTIRYEGSNYGAFAVRLEESVWGLYVQKSVSTDTVTLQDWWMSTAMEKRCAVTFPGTLTNSLPNPYYRATPLVAQHVLDSFFPVGYVLILYSHADPNAMYPGTTWERINNAFLWACDANGTIDGTVMGSKTKTLTVANLPAHTHGATYTGNATTKSYSWLASSTTKNMGYEAISTGEGEPFNIMPPYVQVAVWHRTA